MWNDRVNSPSEQITWLINNLTEQEKEMGSRFDPIEPKDAVPFEFNKLIGKEPSIAPWMPWNESNANGIWLWKRRMRRIEEKESYLKKILSNHHVARAFIISYDSYPIVEIFEPITRYHKIFLNFLKDFLIYKVVCLFQIVYIEIAQARGVI